MKLFSTNHLVCISYDDRFCLRSDIAAFGRESAEQESEGEARDAWLAGLLAIKVERENDARLRRIEYYQEEEDKEESVNLARSLRTGMIREMEEKHSGEWQRWILLYIPKYKNAIESTDTALYTERDVDILEAHITKVYEKCLYCLHFPSKQISYPKGQDR